MKFIRFETGPKCLKKCFQGFRPNFEQIRKIIIFYSMWCHFQKISNFNNLSTCQIYRNIWSHGDQEKRPSISSEESISDYEQVIKINNLDQGFYFNQILTIIIFLK